MKNRIFILAILFVSLFQIGLANNDSVKLISFNSFAFRGVKVANITDTSCICQGIYLDKNFNQLEGFFMLKVMKNDTIVELTRSNFRKTNLSCDTIFHDWKYNKVDQTESFKAQKYVLSEMLCGYPTFIYKSYDYKKDKWIFSVGNFKKKQVGREHIFEDISNPSSYSEDKGMWMLCVFIATFLIMFIICKSVFTYSELMTFIVLSIALASSVMATFLSRDYQFVLCEFGLLFILLLILEIFLKLTKKKLSMALHAFFCVVALFICALQFCFVNESIHIDKDTNIELRWKRGTDWFVRYVVKKSLKNLIPIKIRNGNLNYIVYISKYEFSKSEWSVINNDLFSVIDYCLFNEPLNDLSYREAQLVLERIYDLCGVKLYIPTYNEWRIISLGKHHATNDGNLKDVDDGVPNSIGFVHVADNSPEYTSDYVEGFRIGYDAQNLYRSYSHIKVVGNAYVSKGNNKVRTFTDSSIVNKNLEEGNVGFRIAYRPDAAINKDFKIVGVRRTDIHGDGIPNKVELISFNGIDIKSLHNFEDFEDMLIEQFHAPKDIVFCVKSTSKRMRLSMPVGVGYYNWTPVFTNR